MRAMLAKVGRIYYSHLPTNAVTCAQGKINSWEASKAEAVRRDAICSRKRAFLLALPAQEKSRLAELSDTMRDDSKGETPGSDRGDEEERLFKASLPANDREFLEASKGLGNSQKAEVAWLEKMGYRYEELDVRDFVEASRAGSRSGRQRGRSA